MSNDTTVSDAQVPPWLLLIHAIPPEPAYFRVKVRRRLQRLGAAALKNSVYVLPNNDESLEDFQWLARLIQGEGGEAMVCEASFLEGISDADITAMFESGTSGTLDAGEVPAPTSPRGATWVTRQGIKVDRMASAWLIRRFIDPAARFKFVPARGYQAEPGELRFDMFGGEYTHEGDGCTFETLLARFGLKDAALRRIGEIVHDIDCKDGKFERPETGGISALIQGIVRAVPDDAGRLERGAKLMDELHESFAGR